MTAQDFIKVLEIIAKRIGGRVEENDSHISLFIGTNEYAEDISDINKILAHISFMYTNNMAMYDNTTYEIALDPRLHITRLFDKSDIGDIEDCENQIKYTIGVASLEYIFWVLFTLEEKEIRRLRDISISRPSIKYESKENVKGSLFDFLQNTFRSIVTIKIKCAVSKSEKQFEQLFDAFRFQVANNYNDVIMPIDDFKELCIGIGIVGRRMVNSSNEFTAPKRIYINELTNQYYMGLSSKLPFVEFICYYHVMEYFFEKVYNDDMIRSLQDKISSPRFSIKREQDIKDVIKFITKKVHDKNERYDINELEALELVLKKYIDIVDVQTALPNTAIDYYRTFEVPFSKGDMVDFNDMTNPKLYKKLAARIYKTRNSIIHSKSGEKAVYSPFTDDEALAKEIPLLRYIAEEIIIKTSVLM